MPGEMDSAPKRYALRFISGKYQGGEFPLQPNREIVIGRSSDLDMVLVEDMVSRKHAKILTTDREIAIQDLGSTNGTFVNGEKVKKARLKEGDRILIGTSILKLVALSGPAGADADKPLNDAEIRTMLEQVAAKKSRTSSPMSGKIEEVPVPDLLQLFSTSKKSGVLIIRPSAGGEGRIYLRNGRIYYASINNQHELGPQKAFQRILGWPEGLFELTGPSTEKFMLELDESTESLLMEAARQTDELKRLEPQLPAPTARFALASPLNPPLRELNPDQLDTLQLIVNTGRLSQVLDKSLLSDLDTWQAILHLIRKGYIREARGVGQG
jgi:pSer/pThr/pTyr-binding forkhead associated (FHA) protein